MSDYLGKIENLKSKGLISQDFYDYIYAGVGDAIFNEIEEEKRIIKENITRLKKLGLI